MSICRGFGFLRGGGERGEERGERRKMKEEEEEKRGRKKRRRRGEVKRKSGSTKMLNLSPFFFFLFLFLLLIIILPTNKMPLFSNTAISVFDEKFPGSGLVFDSLSLDIRCYKTVQVFEREASYSSPSQFLSLTLPLLLSFPSNKSTNNNPIPPLQAKPNSSS